jgi:nitrogen-specific signal transduction histidine kinase
MAANTDPSVVVGAGVKKVAAAHLITTGSGRIVTADAAAARLLRRSIASLVQRPLAALVEMESSDFRSRLAVLPDAGHIEDWHVRIRMPDGNAIEVVATVDAVDDAAGPGELRWTLVSAVSRPAGVRDGGDPGSDVALFGRELSQLAHELNQPLAAIITFVRGAQLRLRKDELSKVDLETALETIAQEALRANAIARNLGQRWRAT